MANNVDFKSIIGESGINHGCVSQQFKLGQENDFCVFFMKWCEELKNALDNETGDFVYYDLALRGVVTNSFNNLKWQLIWDKLDSEIITSTRPYISGCIRIFVSRIREFISPESFVEKVKNCKDIISVYFLYMAFFGEGDKFKKAYVEYLSEFVKQNNCLYEDCFKELYTGFSAINNRDLGMNKFFNLDRNRDTDLRQLIDLFIEIPCISNIEFNEDSVIFEDATGQKIYVKR